MPPLVTRRYACYYATSYIADIADAIFDDFADYFTMRRQSAIIFSDAPRCHYGALPPSPWSCCLHTPFVITIEAFDTPRYVDAADYDAAATHHPIWRPPLHVRVI